MIVIDASVLATALADDGADGDRVRMRMANEVLVAPEIVDLEVLSVFRRQACNGKLPERRAMQARSDLASLPIRRVPHTGLVERCWELQENLTVYDASYVAVAEAFEVPLVTADGRLSRSPGLRCRVEVLASQQHE